MALGFLSLEEPRQIEPCPMNISITDARGRRRQQPQRKCPLVARKVHHEVAVDCPVQSPSRLYEGFDDPFEPPPQRRSLRFYTAHGASKQVGHVDARSTSDRCHLCGFHRQISSCSDLKPLLLHGWGRSRKLQFAVWIRRAMTCATPGVKGHIVLAPLAPHAICLLKEGSGSFAVVVRPWSVLETEPAAVEFLIWDSRAPRPRHHELKTRVGNGSRVVTPTASTL